MNSNQRKLYIIKKEIVEARDTLLANARDTSFIGESTYEYMKGQIDLARNRLSDALAEIEELKTVI